MLSPRAEGLQPREAPGALYGSTSLSPTLTPFPLKNTL